MSAPDLTPLDLPVPPGFEQALGYQGGMQLVAFYWIPGGDELVFDDGLSSATGDYPAWLLWTRHPSVAPALQGFNFGSSDEEATHWLMLDRERSRFYAGSPGAVTHALLEQPIVKARQEAWAAMTKEEQERRLRDMLDSLQAQFLASPPDNETVNEQIRQRIAATDRRCRSLQAWLDSQPP
jgi:hypothetical protein